MSGVSSKFETEYRRPSPTESYRPRRQEQSPSTYSLDRDTGRRTRESDSRRDDEDDRKDQWGGNPSSER